MSFRSWIYGSYTTSDQNNKRTGDFTCRITISSSFEHSNTLFLQVYKKLQFRKTKFSFPFPKNNNCRTTLFSSTQSYRCMAINVILCLLIICDYFIFCFYFTSLLSPPFRTSSLAIRVDKAEDLNEVNFFKQALNRLLKIFKLSYNSYATICFN